MLTVWVDDSGASLGMGVDVLFLFFFSSRLEKMISEISCLVVFADVTLIIDL